MSEHREKAFSYRISEGFERIRLSCRAARLQGGRITRQMAHAAIHAARQLGRFAFAFEVYKMMRQTVAARAEPPGGWQVYCDQKSRES